MAAAEGNQRGTYGSRQVGATIRDGLVRAVGRRETARGVHRQQVAGRIPGARRLAGPDPTKADAVVWKSTLLTPERSARVVNGIWLLAPRRVWRWAVENGLVEDNPFVGVRVAEAKRRLQVRPKEFSEDEWKTILRASLAPPSDAVTEPVRRLRRWAPWVMALTGARGGEVTQLRSKDVFELAGVGWVVTFTPEAGTTKTSQARTVPLHPQLLEQVGHDGLGFLDVVKVIGPAVLHAAPAQAGRSAASSGEGQGHPCRMDEGCRHHRPQRRSSSRLAPPLEAASSEGRDRARPA
jgi:hypothetical protein